jgi:predicted acyltransferase
VRIPLKRIAQVCAAVAAVATFLPWQTTASESGTESVQGIGANGGQLVLVVCLVTIGLIQVGWRPAWIGVGFGGAIAVREMFDSEADPATGLWLAAAACLVAVVLLIWEMFANVSAPGDDTGDSRPDGRGLSGPLGRRRR